MSDLQTLYQRNEQFVETFGFADLAIKPEFSTIVLTCIDARVDPAHFLGLRPGEAVVLRNSGGRVTEDVERDLAILWTMSRRISDGASPNLSLAVIHHADCGLERFASAEVQKAVSANSGIALPTLEKLAISDHGRAVEEDIARLGRSALVPRGLVVSAHLYDPKTGRLTQMVAPSPLHSTESLS